MYDALLFFHVLAAFFLAAGAVIYTAFALGGPVNRPTRTVAEILWGVGGLGVIVFGIWLALNRPAYEIWDGWVIAALVLWAIAGGTGERAGRMSREPGGVQQALVLHTVSSLAIVLILVDMIWKPGA